MRNFPTIVVLGCAVVILLGLFRSDSHHKTVADVTGYDKVCVDHVEYLQFPHGVTVQRNTQGNVVTCK